MQQPDLRYLLNSAQWFRKSDPTFWYNGTEVREKTICRSNEVRQPETLVICLMGNGQGHGEKEAGLSIEEVPDYGAKSPSKSESFPCGNYRTAYLWLRSTQARLTFIILLRNPMDASYIIHDH